MLQQRATGCVHAAVEDNVRILALDLGENGFEVGFLIGGAFTGDRIQFASFEGLFDFVCQAFTIGSFIVNQRNFLAFQFVGDISSQRRALLVITTNGAENVFEAALG